MEQPIKEQYLVSGFLTLFLVHATQVGVGVLGFQRNITKYAGYDGWISIIIAGVYVHFLITCIYMLVKKADGDLITIHKQVFGKYLGHTLSIIVTLYFISLAAVVLRSYIEIVQVWMFSDLPTWFFSIFAFFFFYIIVSGGFRTVVGLCFLGVIMPMPLFPMLLLPLEFAHFINLLPVWKHTFTEIALGARETTLSFLGFELILMYYPFLKNRTLTQKWAQIGSGITTLIYTGIMLVSLTFYSEEQLNRTVWATLTLYKVVELPFLERFEYVGISLWMVLIAPNIAIAIWAASRAGKRIFNMSQRKMLVIALACMTIISISLPTRQEVEIFSKWVGEFGFYFVFIYIPILVLIQAIVLKVKERKPDNETHAL
ncbi:GerAB/ArcD/ProY family transporter [Halalkalibacter urbisdiaboli]|uniref:GerAB/ArcD/ProY family transporter n=1 Tax=Halalkalibacter urbisdiaboli TaxID=1960589 RepID=UPI000B44DD66|nr:GerAB/ArcD/ProY family transporter [Halalkalibacter urbisdiaboli]